MDRAIAALARLGCRVVRTRLGPGPAPAEVLRRAAGSDGLVCLTGTWAGGGALLAAEPLLVLPAGADPFAALGVQPQVESSALDAVGGGWFGWLGYDGPSRLAFYDHLLRCDADGVWYFEALWSAERDAVLHARREEATELLTGPDGASRWQAGEFGCASPHRHLAAVERAVELIRAGEVYQVNVCTRLSAPFAGSAAGLFAAASQALQPAFGAFVDGPDGAIACLSPELFLRRRGRDVLTSPIKGTWPRRPGADDGADLLRNSAKDAAENVMIVDLMRNDLGRVCETGSVRVASLLDVEPHPGVWHLVSTVTGRLRADVADDALLGASFPPGSVTGAPKVRAVAAIADLEAAPRGAYTGAVGFASPSWGLELSVAIRTFELSGGRIELGVGGGVTADSVPMLEWRECLHKAAPLLAGIGSGLAPDVRTPDCSPTPAQRAGGIFETMLVHDGVPVRLADHLARLDRSCRELYGAGLPADLPARCRAAAGVVAGRASLRVTVAADLGVDVSYSPAQPRRAVTDAVVVAGRGGLWRHKWADRSYLHGVEAAAPPGAVPLFVAPDGTVLETSRGNVVLLAPDGGLVTPPLRDDLLPGVTRRALLDLAHDQGRRVELRPFTLAQMLTSAAFWTSSISGAVVIASVAGLPLPRLDAAVAELADELGGAPTVR